MSNFNLFGFIPGFSGPWELLIVAGIALLLFGHRLPSVMRSLGRGIVEFKKGVHDVDDDDDENDKVESTSVKGKSKSKSDD